MRASLRILVVVLAVVVGLTAGTGWSQEQDIEKELGIHVDKVLEGSEEIKPGEDTDETTPRAIYTTLFVYNYTNAVLRVSWGKDCNNFLGFAMGSPRKSIGIPVGFAIGDFKGDTHLCARTLDKRPTWYKQTVKGAHVTYRWNIRK